MRSSSSIYFAGALLVLLSVRAAEATNAHYGLTISTAATQNVSFSGGVFTATGANAVLNINDLENAFSGSAVTVSTGNSPDGTEKGDLHVEAPVSWTSSTLLTLDAYRSIVIDRPVSDAGAGSLALNTNDGGSGGSLTFRDKGHVVFKNPSGSLTINGAPYTLVHSVESVASAIAGNPHGNFALAGNYDASGDGTYAASPISTAFSGIFEGLGNSIRNLTIDDPDFAYIGLFAELDGGEIRNVGVVNANVTSTSDSGGLSHTVGALLGYDNGSVSGSYSSGTVAGVTSSYGGLIGLVSPTGRVVRSHSSVSLIFPSGLNGSVAGGLVGWSYGTILNSYATGSVSSLGYGGELAGLVGVNAGKIESSFASGSINAHRGAACGGLVSSNFHDVQNNYIGDIKNSYATGSSDCKNRSGSAGGFVAGNSSKIERSYSTGRANGQYNEGGFSAYEDSTGTMERNYWDTTTSHTDTGVGQGSPAGLTGLTTEELQTGLPAGFSPTIWAENPAINNGFPYLIANPPPQ